MKTIKEIRFESSSANINLDLTKCDINKDFPVIIEKLRNNNHNNYLLVKQIIPVDAEKINVYVRAIETDRHVTNAEIIRDVLGTIQNDYSLYFKNNNDDIHEHDYGYENRAKIRFVINNIFKIIKFLFKSIFYILQLLLPLLFLPYFTYYTIAGFLEFIYKDVKLENILSYDDFVKSEYFNEMTYSKYEERMLNRTHVYDYFTWLGPVEMLIIVLSCQFTQFAYDITLFKLNLHFIQFLINQLSINLDLLKLYLYHSMETRVILSIIYFVIGHLLFYNIIINFLNKHKLI